MDQGNRERPFAHGGRDSFDGLGTYVARHEDARNAGFQQVRVTLQVPGRWPVATSRQTRTGDHEAAGISHQRRRQPVRQRRRANEDEQVAGIYYFLATVMIDKVTHCK